MQQSNQSSFNGVISLRTREEVVALIEAVSRVVTVGNVFQNLKQDPQSWRPLLADIIVICKSAQSFHDLCLDPEGKQRTADLVQGMENSKRALGQLFLNLQNGFPSPQEQTEITTELQNVLFNMAEVTDVMEEDQVFRIKRAAKFAFQHVLLIRETTSDYRFGSKIDDFRFAVTNLLQCLNNRLNVLQESGIKTDLTYARDDISGNMEGYITSSQLYISQLTAQAQAQQERSLTPLVLGIKTIIDLIGDTLTKGSCNFKHDQILEDLDKLANAVKQGSASEAAGGARLLVEELNKMKANLEDEPDNSELNDSCNRLSEMTKRLLDATKNALTANSEDAQEHLASTVDDVKETIAHVAKIDAGQKKSSDLRMQLLKAAKNMTTDMGTLVSSLGSE